MFFFLGACISILEEDINEAKTEILIPRENDTIKVSKVQFKWLEVNGAREYQFELINKLKGSNYVVDSIMQQNSLTLDLLSGDYEFKVRGVNNAYFSNYSDPINFVVELPAQD